jgi:electron transfer flavoprotein alpha subunit
MFTNPLDQRAVRAGLELRRAGESVTVLSMGPPDAAPVLLECFAVGVNRVVLVTDRRLAGSDTLVTARTLTAAAHRIGCDLILGGRSSTDSDTGQLLPEIAGLLAEPVVSAALTIVRPAGSDDLEVRAETPMGSASYHLRPPAVIGVSEKFGKPLHPTPDGLREAANRTVERWSLDDLGLSAAPVGLDGSPTVVLGLGEVAPDRRPVVFDSGSVEARTLGALERIPFESRRSGGPIVPGVRTVARHGRAEDEVWVLVTGPQGNLEPSALATLAHVRTTLGPLWPSAVWVGPAPTGIERQAIAFAGAGVAYLSVCPPAEVDSWSTADVIGRLIADRPEAAAGLFVSDVFGREVAGRAASRRSLGLVGDAMGVRRDASGGLLWSKPSFGGGVVALIQTRTRPALATVRPGAFGSDVDGRTTITPSWADRPYVVPPRAAPATDRISEADPELGDPSTAEVIVCVGTGLGGPEALGSLRPHLVSLGAALTATRKVVDAGWVPRHRQAGLTGRSFAPRLVILLGVRGTPNHLIAWRRAGTIVAVNSDPEAPVFAGCDVGIVGDWAGVLPGLVAGLTRRRAPPSP